MKSAATAGDERKATGNSGLLAKDVKVAEESMTAVVAARSITSSDSASLPIRQLINCCEQQPQEQQQQLPSSSQLVIASP